MFWTDDRTDTFASYSTFFPDSLLLSETKAWEPASLFLLSADIHEMTLSVKGASVGIVMDIEGSEYPVMEDLFSSPEVMAYVKVLAVEWHDAVIPSLNSEEAKEAKRVAKDRFNIHTFFTDASL
jgi:hypothetical protein